MSKLTKYLFVNTNKKAMMSSMGYYIEDCSEIYSYISSVIGEKFLSNKYSLKLLNNNG